MTDAPVAGIGTGTRVVFVGIATFFGAAIAGGLRLVATMLADVGTNAAAQAPAPAAGPQLGELLAAWGLTIAIGCALGAAVGTWTLRRLERRTRARAVTAEDASVQLVLAAVWIFGGLSVATFFGALLWIVVTFTTRAG